MTTPDNGTDDPREDGEAPTPAHRAPRPDAPLDLESRPVPPMPPTPPPTPATPSSSSSDADDDDDGAPAPATTDTPTPPAAPPRVSAFASTPSTVSAPSDEGEPSEPSAPSPGRTTPLPVEPGSTTTTRVVPPGATVPLATPDSLAGSTGGSLRAPVVAETFTEETVNLPVERPAPQEEGWVPVKTSRTAAHIWGVVITLLVLPLAWFLLTDGALRTWYSLVDGESAANPAGLLSLAGGIVALTAIALVARASSLGAWIWGGIVAAAGIVALAVPVRVTTWLDALHPTFTSIHPGFGRNLHDYLRDTSLSGLLLVFGVVVLLLALVSHTSRRSGRTEGQIKAQRAANGR